MYCLFGKTVKNKTIFFRGCTVRLDIIKVFYLSNDAQENCFERNIKIYIKTTPTYFGAITIIRERINGVC